MNEQLFTTNPQAEIDYKEASAKQTQLKKEFFDVRKIIRKNCDKNTDLILCTDHYTNMQKYTQSHYEQMIRRIIADINTDILNLEKK